PPAAAGEKNLTVAAESALPFPLTTAESRGRVLRDGDAYTGMYRAYACFAVNTPFLAQNCTRLEREGDEMRCITAVGRRVFRGPMLLGRDINTVLLEDASGTVMQILLSSVRGAKAAFLDGMLMSTAGQNAPTVTALIFVLHRVHDIDSDRAVNEQRWA